MFKSTIQVTLFSIFGIVINFIIQLLLAYFFGATNERDAFFAANSIPTYIIAIISGSLVAVFLPKLIDIGIRKDRDSSVLINNMITLMILLMLLISFPVFFFPKQIVGFLFLGFDADKTNLTAQLLLILCPALFFQALSTILIAVYHSSKLFLRPSFSFLITPVCTILVTYLLKNHTGILSVAIGTSIGWVVTFIFLQSYIGVRYRISFSLLFTDKDFHYCLKKSTPLFLGSIIYRGNTVIEKMVASNFSAGAISYLGYANAIVTMLSSVTINGIATTMFPQLSEAWSAKSIEKFRSFYSDSLKVILILCIPIITVSIVFSKTIIATILERGSFSHLDTIEVSKLLALLMGSYLFLCLNTIPGKIFYITGITGLGLVNAIFEVILYTVLCILLSRSFSYYGIAYAQIISVAFSALFAAIILQVKFKIVNGRSMLMDSLKIILCGALSLALMSTFHFWFEEQSFLIMLFFGGGSVLVYFYVLSLILKEVSRARYFIQRKIKSLIFSK